MENIDVGNLKYLQIIYLEHLGMGFQNPGCHSCNREVIAIKMFEAFTGMNNI